MGIMVAFTTKTDGTACGVGSKVTLSGSIGNAWATETVTKTATAVLTKSDGYQIIIATTNSTAAAVATDMYGGGCLQGLTTENLVCNIYKAVNDSGASGGAKIMTTAQKAVWVLAADWKLATGRTVALAGTAITVIDTSIVMVPNCTAATATFALVPACTDTSGSKKTSVQSLTYFQPKEDPKKTYVGVPRFSKGDSVMYGPSEVGTDAPNTIFAICGAAVILTGASALVAGAAVAFGAAALAF